MKHPFTACDFYSKIILLTPAKCIIVSMLTHQVLWARAGQYQKMMMVWY